MEEGNTLSVAANLLPFSLLADRLPLHHRRDMDKCLTSRETLPLAVEVHTVWYSAV
jgi:hypothetical protein